MQNLNQTFTITLGDRAENHKGMQIIGNMVNEGFTLGDLQRLKQWFESEGGVCETHDLSLMLPLPLQNQNQNIGAHVLVAKGGLDVILRSISDKNSTNFYVEQDLLDKDKKVFMYGRVVNKHARHNLCFSEHNQEPDYPNGKGRVVAFNNVPILRQVKEKLASIIGAKAANLQAEGNYYYDITKCGIGYHGDSERRLVIGIRVGAQLPLQFVWFQQGVKVGIPLRLMLDNGDIYFSSEKATGNDWKRRNILTLRHAAGAEKFLRV